MNKKTGNSILSKYFISYCCIAIIPVIVLTIVVVTFLTNNFENNARERYQHAISQAGVHIDAIIQEMQSSVSQFSTDNKISDVLTNLTTDPNKSVTYISSYLLRLEQSSRLQSQVLFYSIGSTKLYTSAGLVSYQEFERELSPQVNLNLSSFFTLLNSTNSFAMRPLVIPADDQQIHPGFIAAMFPCYAASVERRGTIVFLIPMENILDVIYGYLEIDPDYFYLYNSVFNLIGYREMVVQTPDLRSKALRSRINTIAEIKISGTKEYVLRYKSDIYGFHLVTAINKEQLYHDIDVLRRNSLLSSLLILSVAGIAAVMLALYSYRPIRALLRSIEDKRTPQERINEFELIGKHLSDVHAEMVDLQQRLTTQTPLVKDRLLFKLLCGTIEENDKELIKNILPWIMLESNVHFVVLISVGHGPYAEALFAVDHLKLSGVEISSVYLDEEKVFAAIISCSGKSDCRYPLCEEIAASLAGQGIIPEGIGAGRCVEHYDEIPSSYLESFMALHNNRRSNEEKMISVYSEILRHEPLPPDQWLMAENSALTIYLQSIQSVDQKTALQLLENLLTSLSRSFGSAMLASYVRFDLFARILALCEPEIKQSYSQSTTSIDIFADEDKFRQLLTDLTVANCTALKAKRNARQQNAQKQILHLLTEHCCEPDFSLNRLSELSNYSVSYVARCLREETGAGFSQLVSNLRMVKAKRELTETDDLIKNIVARCGYQDIASFTRKFRETEGVTPGEYREISRKA